MEVLDRQADQSVLEHRTNGWAYVISGGIVLGISLPGYYLSEDVFARGVYSVGETLGVAAIGYGAYLALIDGESARFRELLRKMPDLTPVQRDRLAQLFLEEAADRARRTRRIRAVTHGLTAALNLTNGVTASQRELQATLYFLGGINLLAAAGALLVESEEEKTWHRLARVRVSPVISPGAGPSAGIKGANGAVVGFQVHF